MTPLTPNLLEYTPQPLSLFLLARRGVEGGRGGRGLSWCLARLLVGVRFGRVLAVGVVDAGAGVWVLTSRSVVTSGLHNDVAGGGPTCVWERDVSRGEAARCLPSLVRVRARDLPQPPPQHRLRTACLPLGRNLSSRPPFTSIFSAFSRLDHAAILDQI